MRPFTTAADVSGGMELEDRAGRSTIVQEIPTKGATPSVRGVSEGTDDDVEVQDAGFSGTKSTTGDAADMRRMGKDQQMVRHFRQLSMTSFLAIANPAWEIGLFVFSPALQNGGRPMLVWSLLCTQRPGRGSGCWQAYTALRHPSQLGDQPGISLKWHSQNTSGAYVPKQQMPRLHYIRARSLAIKPS